MKFASLFFFAFFCSLCIQARAQEEPTPKNELMLWSINGNVAEW